MGFAEKKIRRKDELRHNMEFRSYRTITCSVDSLHMNNEKKYHIKYASKHLNYAFPEIDCMPHGEILYIGTVNWHLGRNWRNFTLVSFNMEVSLKIRMTTQLRTCLVLFSKAMTHSCLTVVSLRQPIIFHVIFGDICQSGRKKTFNDTFCD